MAMSERECGDHARDKRDMEARDAAIAEAYTSGTKIRDIAVLQGVSVDTVKAVARARCTPRKPPSTLPPITPEIVAIAQRRQAAGDRMIDVANDLGIDYKRLRRKLRDILVAEQRRQT
jgi:transposase